MVGKPKALSLFSHSWVITAATTLDCLSRYNRNEGDLDLERGRRHHSTLGNYYLASNIQRDIACTPPWQMSATELASGYHVCLITCTIPRMGSATHPSLYDLGCPAQDIPHEAAIHLKRETSCAFVLSR